MKKVLTLMLAAALTLSLTACGGKSDAAKAVDEQIAAIGEVTLESESKIAAAEDAAAALQEEDKKQLDNLESLTEARAAYDSLVLEAEADEIEAAISAIGTVTLESGDSISSAESAYMGASAEVQALVENISELESAKETLDNLQITEVVNLIDNIGDITLESVEHIETAKAAYDALSDSNQAKVQNADKLKTAAEQITELKREQAEALLSNMRLDEDKVQKMRFYTPKVVKHYSDGSWAADIRCFVVPYLGRDSNSVWLRLICNYTGDDWVFWKKLTFAVDDERYTKTFSYYDVVRNNDGGGVWEYIDTDVSASDIEMLWAIANSTETIVRFEGDDYTHDFTVNSDDKQAIRDVLTAYEALS